MLNAYINRLQRAFLWLFCHQDQMTRINAPLRLFLNDGAVLTAGLIPRWLFVALALFSSSLLAQPATDHADIDRRLLNASPGMVSRDPELQTRMYTLAQTSIDNHCAGCHGADLKGELGVPDLTDSDWLWEVTGFEASSGEAVMSIMQTILYGVRDTNCDEALKRYGACPDTRFSQMPGYGELFDEQQLNDITSFVLNLGSEDVDSGTLNRGRQLWPVCIECHGEEGWGDKAFGGPDLSDDIWLYGGSFDQVSAVIAEGRQGQCPPFADVLDPVSIKSIAVHLYSLSFGL